MTVNKPWGPSDLVAMNIPTDIEWAGDYTPANDSYTDEFSTRKRVRTYHQPILEYRRKLVECQQDFATSDALDNRNCYPEVVIHRTDNTFADGCATIDFNRMRYGRYCGKGYPDFSAFRAGSDREREPIDGVDYCCRLHDDLAWAKGSGLDPVVQEGNACGMVMCLRHASGMPANIENLIPDVVEARACWKKWADAACPGGQPNLPKLQIGP